MKITLFLLIACAALIASEVPNHVFLFLTGVEGEIRVSFTLATTSTTSQILYGTTTTLNTKLAVKEVEKFVRPSGEVQYIHTITLSKLSSAKEYYYKVCATAETASCSSVFKFKSMPAATSPVTLGLYGDLGSYGAALIEKGPGGLKTTVAKNMFDLIIHYGDFAYNLGANAGKTGEEFMENIEPISSQLPYLVLPGNHEYMNAGDSEKYYRGYFSGQAPLGNNSGSTQPLLWWSFDIGTAHVVGISSEVYCEDTAHVAAQYAWLEKDLTKVAARETKPWIIALGHRQMYDILGSSFHMRAMRLGFQCTDSSLKTCDTKPCLSGKNCAYSIQDLFTKYGVNMYVAGHAHDYRRHFPISNNLTYEVHPTDIYVNPQNPVHIVSGAPGVQNAPPSSTAVAAPCVVADDSVSYSALTVYNGTHLRFEQINGASGALLDSFWMVKDPKQHPWSKVAHFTLGNATGVVCDQ